MLEDVDARLDEVAVATFAIVGDVVGAAVVAAVEENVVDATGSLCAIENAGLSVAQVSQSLGRLVFCNLK